MSTDSFQDRYSYVSVVRGMINHLYPGATIVRENCGQSKQGNDKFILVVAQEGKTIEYRLGLSLTARSGTPYEVATNLPATEKELRNWRGVPIKASLADVYE